MTINIQRVFEVQRGLLASVDTHFKRFLYNKIDFTQRLVGIVGPRGVGKTTLILQYLKEYIHKHGAESAAYILADSVLLQEGDLLGLVRALHIEYGVSLVCIDEIHRFKNWNQELKNIYDSYPRVRIIFSGSSSIDLIKGKYDLSRRGVLYHLPGFSFREYLAFYHNIDIPAYAIDEIISQPTQTCDAIIDKMGDIPLLKIFNDYIMHGYYPFYDETHDDILYTNQVGTVVDKVVYEDISSIYSLKTKNLDTFKQILFFFASATPGEVSVNKLANSVKKNHATVAEYLEILHDAGLLRFLTNDKAGHRLIRHTKKVYLDNTNLLNILGSILGKGVSDGTVRETFFINQVQNAGYIPQYNTVSGDFALDDYVFEIGGHNKTRDQVAQYGDKGIVVQDGILVGNAGVVPLYVFGFLY